MKKRGLTQKEKWSKIKALDREKIRLHWQLIDLKREAQKGNETIAVLVKLLEKEINAHNGILQRKITKLRNTGTID